MASRGLAKYRDTLHVCPRVVHTAKNHAAAASTDTPERQSNERRSREKAWNGNVHTAPGVDGSHGLLPRPSEIASQSVLQHHGMGQAIPYHTKYLHGVSPHYPLPGSPHSRLHTCTQKYHSLQQRGPLLGRFPLATWTLSPERHHQRCLRHQRRPQPPLLAQRTARWHAHQPPLYAQKR